MPSLAIYGIPIAKCYFLLESHSNYHDSFGLEADVCLCLILMLCINCYETYVCMSNQIKFNHTSMLPLSTRMGSKRRIVAPQGDQVQCLAYAVSWQQFLTLLPWFLSGCS